MLWGKAGESCVYDLFNSHIKKNLELQPNYHQTSFGGMSAKLFLLGSTSDPQDSDLLSFEKSQILFLQQT